VLPVILAEQYRIPASSRVRAGQKLASRIFFESGPKSRLEKLLQVADLYQEKVIRLGRTCTRPSSTAEERDATGNVTKRFFGAGEQIGGINYYFAKDHLRSIREMTDSSGAVRARYEYDPYGRQTKVSGDLEADFGFTGFYRHQASGLNLMKYRAYDPELARWTSREPLGELGPDGPNMYGYVGNDPINYFDLGGLYRTSMQSQAGLEVAAALGWIKTVDTALVVGIAAVTLVAHEVSKDSKQPGASCQRPPPKPPKPPTTSTDSPNSPNGDNEHNARGREREKWYDFGEGYVRQFEFENGTRADGVNFNLRHIKELKPENLAKMGEYMKQLEGYIRQAEIEFPTPPGGTPWTGSIVH
jgi:RHS repeat-associated protein